MNQKRYLASNELLHEITSMGEKVNQIERLFLDCKNIFIVSNLLRLNFLSIE